MKFILLIIDDNLSNSKSCKNLKNEKSVAMILINDFQFL